MIYVDLKSCFIFYKLMQDPGRPETVLAAVVCLLCFVWPSDGVELCVVKFVPIQEVLLPAYDAYQTPRLIVFHLKSHTPTVL